MADNEDDLVDYDEEEVRKLKASASLSDVRRYIFVDPRVPPILTPWLFLRVAGRQCRRRQGWRYQRNQKVSGHLCTQTYMLHYLRRENISGSLKQYPLIRV